MEWIRKLYYNIRVYLRCLNNPKEMVRNANKIDCEYNISNEKECPIRVMTFNIRYETDEDKIDYYWDKRLPRILRLFSDFEPDIMGLQEVLPNQLIDILEGLKDIGPDFNIVGKPRKKGDEANPILYNPLQLYLLEDDTIWLSNGKDGVLPRIVTYALFERDHSKVLVFNTHLENNNMEVRKKQIVKLKEVIEDKMNEFNPDCALLTGDFNADHPPYIPKLELIMHNNGSPYSFHGYQPDKIHRLIDYIYCSHLLSTVNTIAMFDSSDEIFPSDHRPRFVDVKL